MGGDCTWTGCVPSKSLIASAKAAHAVRTSDKYSVTSSNLQVNMTKITERVRANVERIHAEEDSVEVMAKLGIDTILGKATFQLPTVLEITLQGLEKVITLEAKEGVVVATGAQTQYQD